MAEVNQSPTETAIDPDEPIAYVSRLALARLISGPEDGAQSLTLHRASPNQLKSVPLYLRNQTLDEFCQNYADEWQETLKDALARVKQLEYLLSANGIDIPPVKVTA